MTETMTMGSTDSIPSTFPPALREPGLLINASPGLYGWGAELEAVYIGLERMLTDTVSGLRPRFLRFPPLLPRAVFERSEYTAAFPQLFGAVHAFDGDENAHESLEQTIADGRDWSDQTRLTDFVLAPASCHRVYPLYSGVVPDGGAVADVSGFCFRHEPSTEPGRLVMFRMHEFVRIGTAADATGWFDEWQGRADRLVRALGLRTRVANASDPFFGSGGTVLAENQREQNLKVEVLAPIGDHEVAVASVNRHGDHFGRLFGISTADGRLAHSACAAFGLERMAFALVAEHGPDLDRWPDHVRSTLWG